ncbi:cytochrome P450 CYP736A12-like [Pyrus ussuriensis x Pyrus communis]|uniref:Cytochrome P450 CYP736A12-like n=1 Tax=Pyrus ussuriensis x Pyrus communis TaxID=2448454 RepID=A0A5N5HH16_9ROSA|nr:cytochrome P450 CYP736A12-like [Pyrus ussuriensis x Pyrus communis]
MADSISESTKGVDREGSRKGKVEVCGRPFEEEVPGVQRAANHAQVDIAAVDAPADDAEEE